MKTPSQRIGIIVLFCLLSGCIPAELVPTPFPAPISTFVPTPPSTQTMEIVGAESLQLGLWHDMVYFKATEQVILINGGPEEGKSSDDPVELWTWDGSDWTLLSADVEGPRWRNFTSVVYDSGRDVLVLYGGVRLDEEFQDTWEWNGVEWNQITGHGSPGPREAAGMAYDAGRGKVVLFGGAVSGQMMDDTWEWDGLIWTQIHVEGPSARFPAGFVYNAADQNILLFGGHKYDSQGFTTYDDTWMWDGDVWTFITSDGPSPRDGARAIYDPVSKGILLFGGAEITNSVKNLNDSWFWNGAQWKQLDVERPPARVHSAMAFDTKRGVAVLTGGSNGPDSILGDTWEWDGEAWLCVDSCE